MTSYLVTMATDSHQASVKMWLRDMLTATENGRSRKYFVLEKFKKNLKAYASSPFLMNNAQTLDKSQDSALLNDDCLMTECHRKQLNEQSFDKR